jgi:hypothetical protein
MFIGLYETSSSNRVLVYADRIVLYLMEFDFFFIMAIWTMGQAVTRTRIYEIAFTATDVTFRHFAIL